MPQTIGSRAQVMHGNAKKTSGGLTKSQLKYNKQGKIVSKKASALAKKNNRLVKAGYVTRKGIFGISGGKMKGGEKEFFKVKVGIGKIDDNSPELNCEIDISNITFEIDGQDTLYWDELRYFNINVIENIIILIQSSSNPVSDYVYVKVFVHL